MTKTNEGRPLHNASYSTSASAYKLLALSRDSARPLWNAQDNPEEAPAAGVVIELRRSIGYPLPLSTAESPRGAHFFVPSTRMHSCIATIMRLDAGNSHTGGILRLPEGRHVLSRSKIREIGACVAASGWTIDDERLFNLVAGLQEGESPREAMLCGQPATWGHLRQRPTHSCSSTTTSWAPRPRPKSSLFAMMTAIDAAKPWKPSALPSLPIRPWGHSP